MDLATRFANGETFVTAWSTVRSLDLIDALGRSDYDAITLDMQHGAHDEASVYDGLTSLIAQNKPTVVRIPVGRNDMASRALDFGAEAVIAPMINSVEDARAFAAAMKYPPVGERSWGPTRALTIRGITTPDYLATANTKTVSFAMIETRRALAALDDILAVDGIDAVFVGPSDFSISWTDGAEVNPSLEEMQSAVAEIARKAKAAGKFAGIYAIRPDMVGQCIEMGYQLIASGSDVQVIAQGSKAILAASGR